MTNRRTFIATLIGGMAGIGGWRYFRSRDEEAIIVVLRKRLDYLTLDVAGLHAFAADLSSRRIVSGTRLKLIGTFMPVYRRLRLDGHNMLEDALRHGEERIVSNYLLSSDFFINGADETRPVHYLGFYDALKACSNPFARFSSIAAGAA